MSWLPEWNLQYRVIQLNPLIPLQEWIRSMIQFWTTEQDCGFTSLGQVAGNYLLGGRQAAGCCFFFSEIKVGSFIDTNNRSSHHPDTTKNIPSEHWVSNKLTLFSQQMSHTLLALRFTWRNVIEANLLAKDLISAKKKKKTNHRAVPSRNSPGWLTSNLAA